MKLATAIGAAVLLAACGGSAAQSSTLNVFAAASLTDSFKALAASYEQQHHGLTVKLNFAGTPTLVAQIEQGAHADVFAAADTANMDRLEAGAFTSGDAQVFAHNELEIVVAPGNPKGISSLADFAKPGVIYISEAATVPAGKYSLQALQKAHVSVTPKSLETDVKSVISKIELGEADAGIVYATDVKAAGPKVQGVTIPAADNVIATYPIVAVKGASNAGAAAGFIAYVLSAEGQSTLVSFGFQHR